MLHEAISSSCEVGERQPSCKMEMVKVDSEFYLEVPVVLLLWLLRSAWKVRESVLLNALLVLESDDGTSAEAMAESGAIEALLELLRCHQYEEAAARLLEVLLNNVKVQGLA
ncbi:Protein CELLULOSE SYNTHASE INTERACTIVE 1 [Camellia lanceoleosa]|uniref:Protein CELLULOSE SYNTHASE INTERACTIVE 1 n=1 Tax=Camellia lanceoleosa TaxID=1840588 RepID=A0ACC0FAE5_9ERIC|nr:Protein CELLULOSE SYNTHASE INTERACTIVE 1 [Camellia lanceoleosa]